ncbi:MarC family protein [Candidatus Woesearchaeota archaeon]|nr:MarC family protein [Candidatus Woesearchaeota archaeon]
MIDEVVRAFLALFVAMDVIGTLPIFYSLTTKFPSKQKASNINRAITIAAIILFIFLVFGNPMLYYFGIDIESFEIAGGIILFIVGVKIILNLRLIEKSASKYEIASVPMATPLITGPATITTVMLIVAKYGYFAAMLASAANIFLAWLILRQSEWLFKVVGRQGSDVLSRLFGLILVAMAVQMIRAGIV